MRLTELRITLNSYGKDEGQYTGKVRFTNKDGDIALKLNASMCEEIFTICADGMIDVAKEAAANMTCSIIEHKSTIESK